MRHKIPIIIALLLLAGCNQKKEHQKPAPPNVTTTEIKQEDVPIYVDTIGQVISKNPVYIRPQVAGKLIKAYIKQGAIVKAGDLLYEIDPRPYQAILDEAIAQKVHDDALLKYAESAVNRYKQVVEEDFISVLNYEQYQSNADAAKAQVELDKAAITAAQINVDFCKVTAPVTGKISYFSVFEGDIVAVDDPTQITILLPMSPIDIQFSLPQQHFELIRHEQGNQGKWKFIATLPEDSKHPFEGISYFIDNQIDQDTGTILLKGRLPNKKLRLWPGEFVRVKVLYKMAPGALVVPLSALLIGKDGPYIYTVDKEGKAVATNVTVLTKTEQYAALQSTEVHVGDTVIVDGQINVAPGIMVNVVAANQP